MGLDVELKVRRERPISEEELEAARVRFQESFPDEDGQLPRYPDLQWSRTEPVPTVEVSTLSRYYGPGYERGNWPHIQKMGDLLVELFGEDAEVRYGSDSAWEWDYLRPWSEIKAECAPLWDSVQNAPYHEYFKSLKEDT